jgi:sugar phosphate isomerase/epimerase
MELNEARDQVPLSIQLAPEDDYFGEQFAGVMRILKAESFSGVELNITDFSVNTDALRSTLEKYGLRMTMVASGAFARRHGYSLSHENRDVRARSIDACAEVIDFAARMRSGVIFGFMKGGVTPDISGARERFAESLSRIEPLVRELSVPLLIEATNRYESSVANSVEDAVGIIRDFDNPYLRVLPDTYHMNIEESSVTGTLARHLNYFDSIHVSDNNRFFPGFGSVDFKSLFAFLRGAGYRGGAAIEGNLKGDAAGDIRKSAEYLRSVMRSY